MNNPRLAEQIRALRQRAGKTVREAAEGSGYSYQYLNAIENNSAAANPTIDAIEAIVASLGGVATISADPKDAADRLSQAVGALTPDQVRRVIRFAELARQASPDLLDGVILALEARARP